MLRKGYGGPVPTRDGIPTPLGSTSVNPKFALTISVVSDFSIHFFETSPVLIADAHVLAF